MNKLNNKTEIQEWFNKTDFVGSILLCFKINMENDVVLMITSFPCGNSGDINYKLRLTRFEGVTKINRIKPNAKSCLSFSEDYFIENKCGTIELEDFETKIYDNSYGIYLNFGHNFGACEFRFFNIDIELKKGRKIIRKQEEVIIDMDTSEVLDFEDPFKIDTLLSRRSH
jgi:hypothetical protein